VREMLLDVIEEYARHTGHADLLRESVDGLAGEGAPPEFRLCGPDVVTARGPGPRQDALTRN
jgi:hypothetical protein